jgi:hypothetical protein
MKKLLYASLAALSGVALSAASCRQEQVPTYDSRNALFFEKTLTVERGNQNDLVVILDSVVVSATVHPGTEEWVQHFRINLIGNMLPHPTPYRLAVVDELSDADALQYIDMPAQPTFGAWAVSDSLEVTVRVGDIPKGYQGSVTYTLVEDDNFQMGYADNQRVTIVVNNVPTKPSWWIDTIEQAYLGAYSPEKFEAFILATGLISLDGLPPFEMRTICRAFKAWVEERGLTEADGRPMEIPIY